MIDALIFSALMMSIGTGLLAISLFNRFINSDGTILISADKYNQAELIAAIAILVLVVVSLIAFTVRKLRQ